MAKIQGLIQYPSVGCVVEFMLGNKPQSAFVLEEQKDSLRVLTSNKREMRMPRGRLLPWSGPHYNTAPDRQGIQRILEEHQERRKVIAQSIDPMQLWEMAAGEVGKATAQWFAELLWAEPGVDEVAAAGHVLLDCKMHFRFTPPEFEIFSSQEVEARKNAQAAAELRERLVGGGREFLQALWEIHNRRRKNSLPDITPDTAARLEDMLRTRLVDPEDHDSAAFWAELSKGLPELAHLPLFLLQAWGKLPPHYNYLLDRAEYDPAETWAAAQAGQIAVVAAAAQSCESAHGPGADIAFEDLPFFTMDAASTQDIDDACRFEQRPDKGWSIALAFACPALAWPFGSELDKAVMHRASSIYLPESTLHMLPLPLSTEIYSLKAGEARPALLLKLELSPDAEVESVDFSLACVRVEANLAYEECEAALRGESSLEVEPYLPLLREGLELADKLKQWRLDNGAVIIERNDPEIVLRGEGADTVVEVHPAPESAPAQNIVGELMLLANTVAAAWAAEKGVPLIHRTQDVAVPQEYYGIWTKPQDIARVVKVLPQAVLSVPARPHVGVGFSAYATITSPLRRYCDLVNEAQILSFLKTGAPVYDTEQLKRLVMQLSARLDAVSQVQRFRPRYWKLLFLKQQGDRAWHEAVVTEETDTAVFLSLPLTQIILRGKRSLFGDRVGAGQQWLVRVGKINPVSNDIQILEARGREELE